jgi:signal peptidase II
LVAEESADPGEAPETSQLRRRRWALFGGLAGAVLLLDQLSKIWVDASFEVASRGIPAGQPGGPTEVLGELVRIAKTYNDGAIFGLLDSSALFMAVLSVLVIAGITWYEWRHGAGSGPLLTIGLGLLLGGAIGNLIDRVRFGYVIDFVDMGLGETRWYAWNVADAAVFVGILVLFAAALLGDRAIPGRERTASGGDEAVSGPEEDSA